MPLGLGPRREIITIDDNLGYSSYIFDNLKIVNGSISSGLFDGWLGSNNNTGINQLTYEDSVKNSMVSKVIKNPIKLTSFAIKEIRQKTKVQCGYNLTNTCNLVNSSCLFDLINDPCERNDLSKIFPHEFQMLQRQFAYEIEKLVPSRKQRSDPLSDPKFFNFNWNWWQNDTLN